MRLFLAVFFVLQLSLSSVYFGQAETIFDGTKKEYWTNLTSRTDNGGKIRGAVATENIYKLLNEGEFFGIQPTDNEKNKAIKFNPKSKVVKELKHVSFQIEIKNIKLTGDSSFIEFGLFGDRTLHLRKGLNKESKFDLFLRKDKNFIELHNFEQDPSSILITLKYEISNNSVGFPEINLKIDGYEFTSIPYNNNITQKLVYNIGAPTTSNTFYNLKRIYGNFELDKIDPYFYSSGGNSFSVSAFKVLGEKIENLKQNQPITRTRLIPENLNKDEKKVALLIGSNIYGNDIRSLGNLPGVQKDYKSIEDKLKSFNYEIFDLPPKQGDESEGYQKKDVLEKIDALNKWLSQNKNSKTKAIVYFAGHGFLDTTNQNSIQCFALFNDVTKPGVKYEILNETHFYSVAKNCSEFLLISDACRVPLSQESENKRGKIIHLPTTNATYSSSTIKESNSIDNNTSVIMLAADDNEVTTDDNNTLTKALVKFLEYDLSLSDIEEEISKERRIQIRKCADKKNDKIPKLNNLFIHKLSPK